MRAQLMTAERERKFKLNNSTASHPPPSHPSPVSALTKLTSENYLLNYSECATCASRLLLRGNINLVPAL